MIAFAMAGLAEAAAGAADGIMFLAIILAGFLSLIAIFTRSRIALGISFVWFFLLTLLLQPFRYFETVVSDDPDVHYWHESYRQLVRYWFVVAVFFVVTVVYVQLWHKQRIAEMNAYRGYYS